ncbi:hypothetical protein GFS24_03635 [Chitinophaga sp. SYP-B3965]|uniref:hypothetical protein n=1 Tax=Chitinophaga sp. SYP-B3965 TaxID=2663120 RepID=UPI001299765B|nr:hypothetical protein [Chitinophaga sp. SYP-B3965]MRG44188.1 hypothetical protein [Chitinophaga sp. SYP-B3965]
MKKFILLPVFALFSAFSFASPNIVDEYTADVYFPPGYAVGDYIEFLKVEPLDAGVSGYYDVSISYVQGNLAAAATHRAAISHANPALWREMGKVNNNGYTASMAYNFTVDCNTEYANARFRIRTVNTFGVMTNGIIVHIKVRSINLNGGWVPLATTGNDQTVTKLQPMTNEWSLYVGNPFTTNSATVALNVKENGFIGVGTRTPQSELAVAGTITAKKVRVTVATSEWPDFVFEEGYPLPDLSEVAQFIAEKRHLPGIPSASQVEKDGQDIGEMNGKLLQKIEELTLYLIAEQKERKKLEEAVKKLQQQIENK